MIYDIKYLVNIYNIYNAIYIGDMKLYVVNFRVFIYIYIYYTITVYIYIYIYIYILYIYIYIVYIYI